MQEQFEKITQVSLPYDMRNDDPKKNYGIGSLMIWFILKGPKGATHFVANFDIHLPHIEKNERPKWGLSSRGSCQGWDVGYHSPRPMYDESCEMDCDVLGGKCFYDGSSLRAEEWAEELFSTKGERIEPLIWKKLEDEYHAIFD